MRRMGDPPQPGIRYVDRPGAYGIIMRGSELLLTVEDHPAVDYVDHQLPGGGIDPGESPIMALHREVMEETGYRVAVDRKLIVYQRYCYMPEYDRYARKIVHLYVCRAVHKICEPTEPHHTVRWMDAQAGINVLGARSDAMILEQFLGLQ